MTDPVPGPPPLVGIGNPVPRAKWVWLAPTLIVVVVVAAAAAFFAATRMESTMAGPERVSEMFLLAVAEDDIRMSYGLLCEKSRANVNVLEFRDEALDGRAAARAALDRGERSVTGDGKAKRITYTVARRGEDDRVLLRLEREPERWAVCVFDPDAN